MNKEVIIDIENPKDNDLISRQAVLDEINRIGVKGFETYNDYSQLYDFVDTLSSVKPQEPKWIFVSERLPKIDDIQKYTNKVLVTLENGLVCSLSYYCDEQRWENTISHVIAWMPLPQPCREDSAR